jgi:SAM-dependent methyltransferase
MKKNSPERYDRSYFDRWYRDPSTRVKSPAAVRRKASLALSVAEYYLERPIRNVLDVGCGEGNWLLPLKALRPNVRYTGVDPSLYAVERFGRRRGIRHGSFAALEEVALEDAYDLVICSDMLFYLPLRELERGLDSIATRTIGVAFLELYTGEDSLVGDFPTTGLQSASFYRRMLRRKGFLSVGSHCYLGHETAERAMQLEQAS